jgi:hypothetical protein
MGAMAEPNWHKQVAIGTWTLAELTAILVLIGILTFVHPPDPAHPMSLDFLSKAIAVPSWLAGAIILFAILGTRAFLRWKDDRSAPIAPIVTNAATDLEDDRMKKQISELQDQNATLRSRLQAAKNEPTKQSTRFDGGGLPSDKLLQFDPSIERVVLTWPEELQVRISRHSFVGDRGLLFDLANLRSTWIGSFTLEIMDATSWDQIHSRFRESRYFKPFQLANGKELGPGSTTSGLWFLRTKGGKIILGNSQEPVLRWPSEDSLATQVWRLNLRICVDSHHDPSRNLSMLKPLSQSTLLVSWDTSADVVSMVQQH